MINFKEITKENIVDVLKLSVFDNQKDQVESNGDSIAYALFHPEYTWARGIYNDDELVGFACLYLNEEKDNFQLWRFMIDKNHQGKGYGSIAVEMIKKIIKEKFPNLSQFKLSYVPKEKGGAGAFYKKLGFEETDEMWGNSKVLCYKY